MTPFGGPGRSRPSRPVGSAHARIDPRKRRPPRRGPRSALRPRRLRRRPAGRRACCTSRFVRSPVAHAVRALGRRRRRASRCPASSRSSPPPISTCRPSPGSCSCTSSAPARHSPRDGALRRRPGGGRRRRVEDRRGRRGRDGRRRLRPARRRSSIRSRRSRPARRSSSRSSARTSRRSAAARARATCSTAPTSSCAARIENQRIAVMPMEGNAIAVVPGDDGDGHELTVYVVDADAARHRGPTSRRRSSLDAATHPRRRAARRRRVRRQARARRGALRGHRGRACRLRRPVKWVETRSENLISMPHGRGQVQYVRARLQPRRHDRRHAVPDRRRRGRVRGLRRRARDGPDAHDGPGRLPHPEDLVRARGRARRTPRRWARSAARAGPRRRRCSSASSTWPPTSSGSTRSRCGAATSCSPTSSRTRRSCAPTYDSGDYDAALDEALRARRATTSCGASRPSGAGAATAAVLGIGVSAYVEITAGGGGASSAGVDGERRRRPRPIRVGTSAHGQGHATSFAMIVADRLGRSRWKRCSFVQSDTAEVPTRRRHRRLALACSSAVSACRTRPTACRCARRRGGRGDDARGRRPTTSWSRTAASASPACPRARSRGPQLAVAAADDGDRLAVELDFNQDGATFPFGAHVAVVEVDLDTGRVTPLRHVAVDDCGRILNPLIVAGQQHGGIAQGVGAGAVGAVRLRRRRQPAHRRRSPTTRCRARPSCRRSRRRTPRRRRHLNPLGAKGIGESGTIGSTPGGAERGGRRAEPSRGPPHRHPVHAGAGVARHRRRPCGKPAVAVARTAGGVRVPSCPSPRARRRGRRRRRGARSLSPADGHARCQSHDADESDLSLVRRAASPQTPRSALIFLSVSHSVRHDSRAT